MERTDDGKKAQVSIEFMILFIFFLGLLAFAIISVMQSVQDVSASSVGLEAQKELSVLRSKLDTAFLEGDGFSTNFTLPQKIIGLDYSMNVSSGFALIQVNNLTYSTPIISRNVSGYPRKGENALRNSGGNLVIS
jgi:hypothetical protein